MPLSCSFVWRHLCRKSYKDVTPAESRITFSFTFARDVNPRYSCENCAVIQKEKNRLWWIRNEEKKKHLKFPCDSPDSTWQGWCEIETRMIKMAHGGTVHSKICLGYWAEKLKENWKAIFQKPPCWRSLKQSTEQLLSVISQYHQQVVSSSQWQVVITSFNAGSPLLDHWVSNCATLSEKIWSETKLN